MSRDSAEGGLGSLVALRLQELELQVDRVLEDMPESRLEAQRLIADIFGKVPSAEVLHAFTQLADSREKPRIQVELERKLILMRLLVDLEIHALTESGPLDRLTLDGSSLRLPEVIHHIEEFQRATDWDPPELGRSELVQLGKLRKALMPDIDELQAFALVVPRVVRLAVAARGGRMDAIRFLDEKDTDLVHRAFADVSGTCPDGILLFAVALRWSIQEDLHAWAELPASEGEQGKPDGRADMDGATDERSRAAVLEDLERNVTAYHVLSKRMQAGQDAARNAGEDHRVKDLSAAQQLLFAAYLQLASAVRNPMGAVVQDDDPAAAEAQARLLQEIQEVEDSSASRGEPDKEEVLLKALTALRDGRNQVAEFQLPPGARSLRRERLRKRVLIGVAAALAVVAVSVNILLMTRGGRAAPIEIKPGEFKAAMPLNGVTTLGSTMFSEISSWAWKDMPEDERLRRLQQLGSLALEKGYKRVLLMDDDKNELAQWSARDGVHILEP